MRSERGIPALPGCRYPQKLEENGNEMGPKLEGVLVDDVGIRQEPETAYSYRNNLVEVTSPGPLQGKKLPIRSRLVISIEGGTQVSFYAFNNEAVLVAPIGYKPGKKRGLFRY